MTTVLFAWDVRPALRDHLGRRLADAPDVRLIFPDQLDPRSLVYPAPPDAGGLAAHAAGADIVVGWRPTRELLASAPRLRVWINPGAGVQHLVDLFREANAARPAPVALVNGHGNAYFTAQHAVAMLLSLTNRIVAHHNWMAGGAWRKGDADAASIPLRDRTVGLLGYGHINQHVHRFLAGFDVDFAILRRRWPADAPDLPAPAARFTAGQLDAFLDQSDVLVVAVPQTADTTGLIDLPALRRLGPGGLLVNVARGPVVVEADLFAALQQRLIAGAAIDVWYDYQPAPDADGRRYPYTQPFHTLDNVLLSPHRAASPLDDIQRWDEVIENIRRVAEGREDLLNVVDLARGY